MSTHNICFHEKIRKWYPIDQELDIPVSKWDGPAILPEAG